MHNCANCGHAVTHQTGNARKNLHAMKAGANPDPIYYSAFCSRRSEWMHPKPRCENWLHPQTFDANMQVLPTAGRGGLHRAAAVALVLAVTVAGVVAVAEVLTPRPRPVAESPAP